MRKVLSLLLSLHCSSLFATHVVLINPTNDQETFWRLITDLTIDAADDLGIKLTVFYAF